MAIIYGRAESEKEITEQFHDSIKSIEDVETFHGNLKDKLSEDKKQFFEKVPSRIKEEEEELEKIKNDEKTTLQKFDEKIKNLENKKTQGGFSKISVPLKISFVKNFSKRREINKIKKFEKEQILELSEWKENPDRIFNRNQSDKINEIKRINEIKKTPMHAGAKGEVSVIKKLSELSDNYHVFCGVNIEAPSRRYNRAQIDFVVVSRKGVILIEVKNWSSTFAKNTSRNPYKQVDRAGKVLWLYLKSWWFNPRVTNVLLSTRSNLDYNNYYKYVLVSNLDRINYFIENRKEELSDKDVKKVIGKLKSRVTY